MLRSNKAGLVAVMLTMPLAGCASAMEQGPPPTPPQREMQMSTALSSITESVLVDAAKRTGLEQASLRVESAESVTWADGSLGCPQPGMSYTMALVPGYRVKVRAGGQVLDYHASRTGHFFVCPAGRSDEPVPGDRVQR